MPLLHWNVSLTMMASEVHASRVPSHLIAQESGTCTALQENQSGDLANDAVQAVLAM